jgi:glycosyltransferase involved in cell wall biosynthesis
MRLLFSSIHSYLDPSSGAALATREILELLAARGADCRVLSTGVLDYEQETSLDEVMATLDLPVQRRRVVLGQQRTTEVIDMIVGGVRVTLMPTASSRPERSPSPNEAAVFLDLADLVLDRFRPQVLLTYGGHPASFELMRRARSRGIAVVFHLHNFGYNDRRAFADAAAVIFSSEYSRRYHARTLGLDGPVIPYPLLPDRIVAENPEPKYITFINPQPTKGLTVFARIAIELNQRRPDIPLLVVEGRGTSEAFALLPVDLSGLTNLHRMANTPDPRDFYRLSRAVLVPSLWRESLGRVAMEALANGIPVLASDRGALPETLGDAGFIFTIPERFTPHSLEIPTARDVAPWVAVIEKLWDDPSFEATHRALAQAEAQRWEPSLVAERFERFFSSFAAIPTALL